MGVIRKPEIGKHYRHPVSNYTYLVTKVGDTHYEFIYILPELDMYQIWTFRIDEFSEVELTELEEALL